MIKEGCVTPPTCSDDGVAPPTGCEGDVHLKVLSQHGLECPHINRVTRPHHTLHHSPGVREEFSQIGKTVYTVVEWCYWKLNK